MPSALPSRLRSRPQPPRLLRTVARRTLSRLGYDVVRIPRADRAKVAPAATPPSPPPVEPVWPLPRAGMSGDAELRAAAARFPFWHHPFSFEGGLEILPKHHEPGLLTDDPDRPLQRFRHFMPWLLQACGGSLGGKRVLDIACASGWFSIQAALMGARVVGFDARPEQVEQARLIARAAGLDDVEFRALDFWEMAPERLGGPFDAVLCLGILYHLPKPVVALERVKAMVGPGRPILLDTAELPTESPLMALQWEQPTGVRTANKTGVVVRPSPAAIELMLRQTGYRKWFRIPVGDAEHVPRVYREGQRASWLLWA